MSNKLKGLKRLNSPHTNESYLEYMLGELRLLKGCSPEFREEWDKCLQSILQNNKVSHEQERK